MVVSDHPPNVHREPNGRLTPDCMAHDDKRAGAHTYIGARISEDTFLAMRRELGLTSPIQVMSTASAHDDRGDLIDRSR